MARRKSSFKTWAAGLLACVIAAGAAYYYLSRWWPCAGPPRAKPSVSQPVVSVTEQRTVVLYLPRETKNGFILVPERTIVRGPVSGQLAGSGGILDNAVKMLVAASKRGGVCANLIPAGARLLEPVRVAKSTAVVNLSKEFVDNFSGGSDQEALTLNSIVATVVYNSGGTVKQVKIEVEGKTVESLGGHFDLTEPLSPDPALVKTEKGR